MRIYRKIIPKIAREIIRNLLSENSIEIESNRIDEAELDIAAIMVEYKNMEDQVLVDALETIKKRGISFDKYSQVKKNISNIRGLKIGSEGMDYVLEQILEGLFASKNIEEIFAEDHQIKKITKDVMNKYMNVSEEFDSTARKRLKNIKEGTPEWEIEYNRIIFQLRHQKGLI